jgi:hypothetical protein
MGTKGNDILSAALDYSGRGWSIIPVKPGTKKPAAKWSRGHVAPDKTPPRQGFKFNRGHGSILQSSGNGINGEHPTSDLEDAVLAHFRGPFRTIALTAAALAGRESESPWPGGSAGARRGARDSRAARERRTCKWLA